MNNISTTILIINSVLIAWLFYSNIRRRQKITKVSNAKESAYNDEKYDWLFGFCAFISVVLIIVSPAAPYLLTQAATRKYFDFTGTGAIGDTIGGLMNPFIAIAGVIITGIAFFIQYQANQQQRKQIFEQTEQNRIQQFESQFYEMLKLHRENISEMQITGYDFNEVFDSNLNYSSLVRYEKTTDGRKVFVTMKTELECLFGIYKHCYGKLGEEGFKKCYEVFFSGLDTFIKRHPGDIVEFTEKAMNARKNHQEPHPTYIRTNKLRKEYDSYAHLYFNYKPFSGHASKLGHYYRHMYLAVKSVVESDVITIYEDKMKYLKLLRAQISNHEQIHLFYNWLSGYGYDWENNKNAFFTEYKVIHNLWYDILFEDAFIKEAVKTLRNTPVQERRGDMFEVDLKAISQLDEDNEQN